MSAEPFAGRFAARCTQLVAALAFVLALAPALATARTASTPIPHGGYAKVVDVCPSPSPGEASCFALVRERVADPSTAQREEGAVRPFFAGGGAAASGPAEGFTPADLASAYGYSPAVGGGGQTVAIVDAFDDPSIESDLATFDSHYGLSACTTANKCFRKVGQTGGAVPAEDTTGWSIEISLDVETVHAVCPGCKILLVEANNSKLTNLATATNEAVALGATEVSNSYGGGELGFGSTERAAYNHLGIPIVASTGDDGYYGWDSINEGFFGAEMPNAPSSLPSVVSVGGTSLLLNSDGTRASESVWNDNGPEDEIGEKFPEVGASGGGCSLIDTANRWQQDVANFAATGCGTKRLDADVSAVADPSTGLDIFDSYPCGSACSFPKVEGGWVTLGGTSLSAPLVSALYALAGGGGGASYPSLTLYGHSGDAAALYDVTEGGNGYCGGETVAECGHANSFGAGDIDCEGTTACNASTGFDGPSGVGTPNGLGLFELQSPVATMLPPSTLSAGSAAGFSLLLSDAYPGGAPASASWSWGDGTGAGGLSPSHTYAAPGTYTVTLTVTDAYGLSSAPVAREVTVGPAVSGGGGGGEGGGGAPSGGGTTTTGTTTPGTTSTTTSGGSSQQGVAGFQSTSPQAGSARLASSSLKVSSGKVKLAIVCAASGGSCSGTVTLTAPATGHASAAKVKTLTLGVASFTVAAGKTLTVTLHLSRQALAQLARAHSLHATATVVLHTGSGAAHTQRSAVTLRSTPPARRKR